MESSGAIRPNCRKISRIFGRNLAEYWGKILLKVTSHLWRRPVRLIARGRCLVDICMQRSSKRGSGCDTPNEANRFPRSADGSFKASKGFPTPVTSSLRPPKPPRTEARQYSWRNSTRKEECMYICTLKPLKTRKEKRRIKV